MTKACAGIIARAGTCLDAETIAALDCSDAEAAKASRRAGHPTPLARCPAPGCGPKAPKAGSLLAMALALALAAADVDQNEMRGDGHLQFHWTLAIPFYHFDLGPILVQQKDEERLKDSRKEIQRPIWEPLNQCQTEAARGFSMLSFLRKASGRMAEDPNKQRQAILARSLKEKK
ncbi:unnamed protein product [Polarella glacialis]|uniref:Uncharacterized protein n=1 Tax=Polarella glacialis TaxID=89957 RepID=A0A813HXL0_POLGL|nr:unnamed protein product [Polarella glacialis]